MIKRKKSILSNVGYWVVLGLGLWVNNASADVRHISQSCHPFGTCTLTCPAGYVVISPSMICGYEYSDGSGGPLYAYPNSSINPTSISSNYGCSNLTAVCAKVCN